MKQAKNGIVFARVSQSEKDKFIDKSKEHGGQSTVLRNLIARFNADQLKFKEMK